MPSLPKGCWPAAKYLSYGFWRSWILVMYSAPLWGFFSEGAFREAWRDMYAWSTAAFVVVSVLMAVRYRQTARLLSRPLVMVGFGALASGGVFLEYASCAFGAGPASPLFVAGAVATGVGTAAISVRAGEIYAEASAPTAVTNTALCEVAAGLIYFMVLGTIPAWALAIAALLPLAAALMALFDDGEHGAAASPESDEARRKSLVSFVRFMLVVFVLTFAANAARSMVGTQAPPAATNDAAAVTVVILVAFAIAAASSLFRSFRFGVIYYPLVLTLAGALVVAFMFGFENSLGAATMLAVYSLFSMFMWCVLAYIAHGRVWDPVQVFGWGRAVFAVGGLLGMVAGARVVIPNDDPTTVVLFGVILAFVVLASAMLVFRESDVMKIIDGRMGREGEVLGGEGSLAGDGRQPADAGVSASGSGTSGIGAVSGGAVAGDAAAQATPLARSIDPEAFASQVGLTTREREVFPLMLEGRDARGIGEILVISENTAKAHIRNIYAKVGARNRREFVEATRDVLR